ncbi:hypothetical protein BC835DRAFT_1312943 [Cytidiella melzeri]|nr:hypothetical protein BC835DRAFT_1312943 [Cytidiella melzeri]
MAWVVAAEPRVARDPKIKKKNSKPRCQSSRPLDPGTAAIKCNNCPPKGRFLT